MVRVLVDGFMGWVFIVVGSEEEDEDAGGTSEHPDYGGPSATGEDEFPVVCSFFNCEFLCCAVVFVKNVAVVTEEEPDACDDEDGAYCHPDGGCEAVVVVICVHTWDCVEDERCCGGDSEDDSCCECFELIFGLEFRCVGLQYGVFLLFSEVADVGAVCLEGEECEDDCDDGVDGSDEQEGECTDCGEYEYCSGDGEGNLHYSEGGWYGCGSCYEEDVECDGYFEGHWRGGCVHVFRCRLRISC